MWVEKKRIAHERAQSLLDDEDLVEQVVFYRCVSEAGNGKIDMLREILVKKAKSKLGFAG